MIQRIQSIYLFCASVLTGIMSFFNFAQLLDTKQVIYNFGIKSIASLEGANSKIVVSTIPLMAIIIAAAVISFLTIFIYKNRKLQMQLCVVNIFVLMALVGLIALYSRMAVSELGAQIAYSFPVIFPLIAIVLTFMARRGIKKDEELVRSADRIR